MEKNEFNYKKLLLQILIVFVYVICFFTIIIPLGFTIFLYELAFKNRADKPRHVIDEKAYPDLEKESIEYVSNGNIIRGAIYVKKGVEPKAFVIVSHGIGCNMNLYLNRINYFAQRGYKVLGINLKGTGESDGNNLGGVCQSQIDIKNAVYYVKGREDLKNLKLFVYGHSWSGYGCAAMLNDNEVIDKVDGVATMSGFNNTWQSISFQAEKYCGKILILAYPWMMLYQIMKFGKQATYTAIDGINNFKKPILITQSKDDPTVPLYLSVYGQKDKCVNNKAKFMLFEDRGHTTSRPVEVEAKINKDCEGKVYDKPMIDNMFEHFVNMHYEWSTVEDIMAIDFDFMDNVDNFFEGVINSK